MTPVALLLVAAAAAAAVSAWARAAAAEADVRRTSDLLVEAEELWADRHRLAVVEQDAISQLAAMRTTINIIAARAALEARYGHGQGRHPHSPAR